MSAASLLRTRHDSMATTTVAAIDIFPSTPSAADRDVAIRPFSIGIPQALYWATDYDWRRIEANVCVFPGEQYEAPRSWTERAYPNLIYYNKLDKGGHFAAWEQPGLLSPELRAGLRPLRGLI